ncbi:MAG TPA: tyrosine-type recombinase/integrase [Candidatus Nanopelagicales bacterium]|nr:tyrosine-type recombinase/integrase [Candidatus Nanopelagicales bacterium]
MTIRKTTRRGETRLIIDIHYRKPDGTQGRYRKDAQVQTLAAARTEERRLLALIAQHGEPIEPRAEVPSASASSAAPSPSPASLSSASLALISPAAAQPFQAQPPPAPPPPPSLPPPLTFADAVALFRAGKAITRLKPSTRGSYDEILSTWLLPRFGARPIDALSFADVTRLDAELVKERASPSRRSNVQIVLRSVLRAALDAGKLAAMPRLPALPKKGRKVLIPLSAEQVDQLLAVASPSQRIAFALAAFAGLRAGEVRALRWADVRLDDDGSGVLVVRFAQTKGETSTPKSGHEREVPLAPQLVALLQAIPSNRRHGLVATTQRGGPWGEYGLNQALKRAIRRAGCKGSWRYHDLRHFFVTQLFRRGGSAPAVQALAGHLHLTTTQLYAHVAQADLRDTIRLLGGSSSE